MNDRRPIGSFTLLALSKSPMRTKHDRYCHELQVRELEKNLEIAIELIEDIDEYSRTLLKDSVLYVQTTKALNQLKGESE